MKKLEFQIFRPTGDLYEWLDEDETIKIEMPLPKLILPKAVTFQVTPRPYGIEPENYTELAIQEIQCKEDSADYNEKVNRKIDSKLLNRLVNKFNDVMGTHLIILDITYKDLGYADMQYVLTGPDRDILLYEIWFDGEVWLDVVNPEEREVAALKAMSDEALIANYNDFFGDGAWEKLK